MRFRRGERRRPGPRFARTIERTAAGYIAVGENVPDGKAARSTPLVFLSPNGITWQRLDAAKLPVDLAANAASLGAEVIRVVTAADFTDAVKVAKANDHTTVIHVETDPLIPAPDSESWWDVPVSETSTLQSTQAAYQKYAEWKKIQRPLLRPSEGSPHPRKDCHR